MAKSLVIVRVDGDVIAVAKDKSSAVKAYKKEGLEDYLGAQVSELEFQKVPYWD